MSLSWPTGLLSPQPKAHTPHPQGIAEESSYSPLLDFFLRNCKRKQKSGLLVRGSVPGGGRHRGASSLPPPLPHSLPACAGTPGGSGQSQSGTLCPDTHRGQRWPIPSRRSLCCCQDSPAQPPTRRVGSPRLPGVGRRHCRALGGRLIYILPSLSPGHSTGRQDAGVPRHTAAQPARGGQQEGGAPRFGPTAPRHPPTSAYLSDPRSGQFQVLSHAR